MFWRFTLRLVAKKKKDAKRRPFLVVEMRGIDVLFALLRRENHTELLPQLLQLKTVHRTVFFTPQPKGSLPALAPKEKRPQWAFFFWWR